MANTNYLKHYGIMGMKWGQRKDDSGNGMYRKKTLRENWHDTMLRRNEKEYEKTKNLYNSAKKSSLLKKASERSLNNLEKSIDTMRKQNEQVHKEEDEKFRNKMKKKKPTYYDSKTMSDDELRSAINRMNLEKQYRDLMRNDMEASGTVKKGKTFTEKYKEAFENQLVRDLLPPGKDKLIEGVSKATQLASVH